ncbi:MAG TPA: ribonuclease III [Planctomycetaceae bacterium]|nr:ribonuclease III [Planctomycetaceae bacterium]HIQ21421.1 ribonuclease III [Planctomycetota bacterium]
MAADTIGDKDSADIGFLEECERRIGYRFSDKGLLRAALTHASSAEHRLSSNERLEFLGDAVLGFVVCQLLYQRYPDYLEGELTRIKSMVVSGQTCARISEGLSLQDFLILGKGMASHPTVPQSLLSGVFESLLAAIYLDGGIEAASRFVEQHVGPEIELAVGGELESNYKSLLQQLAQREFGTTPTYQLLDEKGPDHSKCFKISARVGDRRYEPAWGRNKKEAEQRAARNALNALNELNELEGREPSVGGS